MAIARLLLIGVVAALASACGAQSVERQGAPTVTKPAAVAKRSPSQTGATGPDGAGGSGYAVFWVGGDAAPPPAHDLYAVFRRPVDADDRTAAAFASTDLFEPGDASGPAAEQLGRPVFSETRLVAGTTQRGVYATPTTTNAICTGGFPNGGSGCGQPGPHGVTLDWDTSSEGSSSELYGMAGDDVRAIEIRVDGTPRTVDVVNNAFLLELTGTGRADGRSVVLHLTDGTTVPLG